MKKINISFVEEGISSRKSADISSGEKEFQSVAAYTSADTSTKNTKLVINPYCYQYREKSTTGKIYNRSSFRNEVQSGVIDKSNKDAEDNYIGSTSFLENVRKNGKKKLRKETDTPTTTFDDIENKIAKLTAEISIFDNSDTNIGGIDIELKKLERAMEKSTTEKENDILDEKLIQLQVKLERIPLDDVPNRRKMQCTERIRRYNQFNNNN
ncbi:hypothetical protein JTB14_002657 [Gonioctena quinquepunctata]|nr:hypothetical protein JTB14_002657 [Gonioctena quinquepunctata]